MEVGHWCYWIADESLSVGMVNGINPSLMTLIAMFVLNGFVVEVTNFNEDVDGSGGS